MKARAPSPPQLLCFSKAPLHVRQVIDLHVQIPHRKKGKQAFTGIQFVSVEKLTQVNVSLDCMTIFLIN